jgi:hypothetical protein
MASCRSERANSVDRQSIAAAGSGYLTGSTWYLPIVSYSVDYPPPNHSVQIARVWLEPFARFPKEGSFTVTHSMNSRRWNDAHEGDGGGGGTRYRLSCGYFPHLVDHTFVPWQASPTRRLFTTGTWRAGQWLSKPPRLALQSPNRRAPHTTSTGDATPNPFVAVTITMSSSILHDRDHCITCHAVRLVAHLQLSPAEADIVRSSPAFGALE